MSQSDFTKIKKHMLNNKAYLETAINAQNLKIQKLTLLNNPDFKTLSKEWLILKKHNKKMKGLIAKLAKIQDLVRQKENIVKIKEKLRVKKISYCFWYSKHPHIKTENVLIVAGKNAKMSDRLKKYLKTATVYYHILNCTGGSVLLFINDIKNVVIYQKYALNFALIFSSFWNHSSQSYAAVTVAQSKTVIGLKKAGAFAISESTKVIHSIEDIEIYFIQGKGFSFIECEGSLLIGLLIRSTEDLVKSIKAVLATLTVDPIEFKMYLQLALVLFPAKGIIVKVNKK